jgi:hypothetical protein
MSSDDPVSPRQLLAFFECLQARGHDFSKGDVCPRCGARKGDATLLDVLHHAKTKKDNPYAQ